MAMDLTAEARAGQDAPASEPPHIFSSPAWLAHRAGQAIAGMSTIRKAAMARGYAVRLRTASSTVVVKFSGPALSVLTIERN